MPHELGRKRGIGDMAGLAAWVRPVENETHLCHSATKFAALY
jgi:hypothetical protein